MIYALLSLASFSQHYTWRIVSIIYSFLLLSHLPLDGWTTVCSLGDKHMDCFHFLEIMNKASVDIHLQLCVEIGFHSS